MSKESALNLIPMVAQETIPAVQAPALPGIQQTAPAVQETKVESQDSTAFAKLAKKEQELVKQRQELAKEREVIQASKKKQDEYEALKKTDPIAAMKSIGFSEQDIFNYMAAQQPKELTAEEKIVQAAEKAADDRIKAFEKQQLDKVNEEQKKADTALISGFKGDLLKTVESNQEKYPFSAHYGAVAQALAYEMQLAVVEGSKGTDVMTPEEAMDAVEEYYKEQRESLMKVGQPKEVAPEPVKTTPERTRTVATNPQAAAETPKPPIQRSRTITNTATTTLASQMQARVETAGQKRERLIEALRNGG